MVGHGPDHVGHVVRRAPQEDLGRVATHLGERGRAHGHRGVHGVVPPARVRGRGQRHPAHVRDEVRRPVRAAPLGRGVGPSGQRLDEELVLEVLLVEARTPDVRVMGHEQVAEEVRQQADLAARLVERRVGGGGVAGLLGLDPLAMELHGGGVVLGDALDGAATDAAVTVDVVDLAGGVGHHLDVVRVVADEQRRRPVEPRHVAVGEDAKALVDDPVVGAVAVALAVRPGGGRCRRRDEAGEHDRTEQGGKP